MWLEILVALLLGLVIYLGVRQSFVKIEKPLVKPAVKTEVVKAEPTNAAKNEVLHVKIFFGSQSGTAESFAYELADEAKGLGLRASVIDLEEYEAEQDLPSEQFAVFLMATFGEGDPTDNAIKFWEWIISEERQPDFLKGVNYAVFALGNRQYEQFCAIGRRVDQRLAFMGANRIVAHGEGDDDANIEEDYSKWKEAFWEAVRKQFSLDTVLAGDGPVFSPSWTVALTTDAPPEYISGQGLLTDARFRSGVAEVFKTYELRQDVSDGGSTKHLDLDISKATNLRYQTADNLGIFPRNDEDLVRRMLAKFNVPPKRLFTQRPGKGEKVRFRFPRLCTVEDAFYWYLDLANPVRAPLLKLLSHYASNPDEKAKILSYTVSPGKEEFHSLHKNMVEVLEEFPSLQVPFEHFIEFAPKLAPRYYTISSSPKASPGIVSVTVSLLTHVNPGGRIHKGVCTHYLAGLGVKGRVYCFVRASSFRLPKKLGTPTIMVGPGTGIAPFRAFLQDIRLFKQNQPDKAVGPATLFFGCRNRNKDYIYKEELEKDVNDGVISNLHVAFSRDQEVKVYVQHLVDKDRDNIWNLIDKQNAYFYVCGGTGMGRSVKDALQGIVQVCGGMDEENAKIYLKKMQESGRYIQELWA